MPHRRFASFASDPSIFLLKRLVCHSERSVPAFSCARFLCAGSRREESLFLLLRRLQIPTLRSSQCGFIDSINATFLARRHALISFSREIAARAPACCSNQTSLVALYFCVKPGTSFPLCSDTRSASLPVTPR